MRGEEQHPAAFFSYLMLLIAALRFAAYARAKVLGARVLRTAKHLLSTRPIFHKLDETIRSHVFCSFFALALKTGPGGAHCRARPRGILAGHRR